MSQETRVYQPHETHFGPDISYRRLRLVKGKKIVNQIMSINKLPIPDVLIDIIKDYLFVDKKYLFTKHIKKYLTSQINHLVYKSKKNSFYNIGCFNIRTLPPPRGYMFMGAEFCNKCGNYLPDESERRCEKLLCNMNCPNNYNRLQEAFYEEFDYEEEEEAWYHGWDEDEEDEEDEEENVW